MRKGFSLVVLVITIIVTIMLAGVVVLIATKNNILGSAEETTFKNNATLFLDELEEKMISKGIRGQSVQVNNLYDEENETEYMNVMQQYIPSFKDTYKGKFVIYSGELKYLSKNVSKEEKQWCKDVGIGPYMTIEIGDIIPGFSETYHNKGLTYTPTEEKTGCDYNSEISQDRNLIWKVMKINNDSVTLIGIPFDTVIINGANGYLYGADELNKICREIYSIRDDSNNILYEARSINETDVLYLSEYDRPANNKTVAQIYSNNIGNTYYPYDNDGEATWNNWTANGDDYEYQTKSTRYSFTKEELLSRHNNQEQIAKMNLLFEQINNENFFEYWVASTCVEPSSQRVNYEMFIIKRDVHLKIALDTRMLCHSSENSKGSEGSNNYSIRPVITVPYDIIEPLLIEE